MSSHTGRVFLHSCLKTPIDPCNNCPAPIYNRPKMYLGRLSTVTPLSTMTKITTSNSTLMKNIENTEVTEATQLWANAGIRSLAKFYDSIPDYCDINHLTEEEFYSTLDSLRTTCRELKTNTLNGPFLDESSLNSTFTSNSSNKKQKKSCKKKNNSSKKGNCKKKSKSARKKQNDTGCVTASDILNEVGFKSKNYFQTEVEAFKQTLKDFEDELINKSYTKKFKRAKSTNFLTRIESPKRKIDENTQTHVENPTVCRLKNLRKAFSYNDINSTSDTSNEKLPIQTEMQKSKFSKAECSAFKDTKKLSNYFAEHQKSQSRATNELPKITIQSPSGETTTSESTTERSAEKLKKEKQIKIPFSIFNMTSEKSKKENAPSPAHPVARPNLAATLRVEVSRKKLKELQNNCTFHDKTPQVDWEVRKTPAWRSLALNEPHKEILALRLATRKAEQALQQREYELNMELMRQRVKSAPLLLEGATFWGPSVGKLTHNCPNEGLKHACENVQRKKKARRQRSTKDAHSEIGFDTNHAKLHELCKIYACSTKSSRQSRNSQHSHSTGRRSNQARRKEKKLFSELNATRPQTVNDSGDELSSADRALL